MIQISREYEEKRNYVRVKVSTPLLYTLNKSPERYEGLCRDLSGAGILIETTKKLKIGDNLHVTIPPTQSKQKRFSAIAEVVRIEPMNNRHIYQAGTVIKKIIE
ncbi:MAG: PilZ domain-containing protein [Pseudomonadales bacterium]|nr:PilZ domain-containing protein [Pseudomonadales bacterium]